MRLYHFTKAVHGLENIAKRRLKVARIDDLNDPFETFAVAMADPAIRAAFQETKPKISREFGFLCFSEDWRNPVQWSHYAEGHRGVCLGFEIPQKRVSKVRYSSKRIAVGVEKFAEMMGDDAFRLRVATTKYSHWSYERERRAFIQLSSAIEEGPHHFIEFGHEMALKEVIVGQRCMLTRAEVGSALGDLSDGVDVFQGRLAYNTFDIVRQQRADLWT